MAEWEPALKFDFAKPGALDAWFVEGSADLSVTEEGELLVSNVKRNIGGQDVVRSTVWHREPVSGDVKYEMEIRGENNNGNIWFFNANTLGDTKSIFDWERPQANYVDYTGEARMEMYTVGTLRSHQDEINFRYLGGTLSYLVDRSKADTSKTDDPDHQGMSAPGFEEKTIQHSAPSPFDDPDRYYRLEVSTVANRIRVSVDGKEVIDYTDESRAANPLRGGWFAFRNFCATKTWCRSLRVSTRA